MAPKDKSPPKAQTPDQAAAWEGPMIELQISVETSSPLFPMPPEPEEGAAAVPPLPAQVLVGVPGAPAEAAKSKMVQPDEFGSFQFGLVHRVSHPLNHSTLETLLNTPITLTLSTEVDDGKKATPVQVATAKMDLLAFGLGEHTIENATLPLEALELPEEVTLLEGASVSLKVQLLKEVVVPAAASSPAPEAAEEEADGQEEEAPEEADPPTETTTALEPTPILTAEEASEGRVVTMKVTLDDKLPDTLAASAQIAGQDLSFRTALWLPSTPAKKLADLGPEDDAPLPRVLLLSKGSFVPPGEGEQATPASVTFADSGHRFFLDPATVSAMTEACQDRTPVLLELARALPKSAAAVVDNAVDMFHGITRVDMAPLADPGNELHEASVKFKKSFGETQAAGRVQRSMLGPLGPAEFNVKGKMMVEGLEPPPPPGSDPRACAWAAAETGITVSLELTAPFFPPWSPPPQPNNTLQELVPKRNLEKIVDPTTASDDFRKEIRVAAKALAAEYHDMFGSELAAEDGQTEEKVMAARQRKLVFELNRTGKYLELKESLRGIIVRVVQEKYRKSGDMGYEEMRGLYNDLYVYLIDEMHRSLNDLIRGPKKALEPVELDDTQLAHLLSLADEYEVNGDLMRATRYHQERLSASKRTDVWHSYGSYLARTGDLPKAIEAFKEVVAIDPANFEGLLCLASVLWQEGADTDVQYLERADSIVQAIMDLMPNNGVAWAMLSLVYADKAAGMSTVSEEEADTEADVTNARNARFKAIQLCQAAQAQGMEGLGANFYMQLALTLLDLNLGSCAAKALAVVPAVPRWEKMRVDVALCNCRAAALLSNDEAAIRYAREAIRHGSKEDMRPHILLGNIHYKAGRSKDASDAYQIALDLGPRTCPLELYLRLGSAFQAQGKMDCALDVFTQGCAARPCASTWLGAGVSSFRMGDLQASDLALTEANILDPHNPLVWMYLAINQLVSGRLSEAEMALKFAFKENIKEKPLLLEMAGCYMEKGMYRDAEGVLRQSILFADGPELRAMLGDAMLQQNDIVEAAANFLQVIKVDGQFSVDKNDANAMHCLTELGKCYMVLGNEAAYQELQEYSAVLLREEKWMETATVLPQ